MTYFQTLVLGLVQGLGEFLPISSSAHLIIAPWALGFDDPGLKYDVELHLGTLIAVVAYFWKDFVILGHGTLRHIFNRDPSHKGRTAKDFRLAAYIVLATIPAAVIGKFLDEYAETSFRHPLLIATTMTLMGALLWYADNRACDAKGSMEGLTLKTALIIGFAQSLALIPGVSRSGITITAALLLGLKRPEAARFSFFLATPITLGAILLKSKFFTQLTLDPVGVTGIIVSAVVGFLSIKYLMRLVQDFSYRVFCYYRFFFGFSVVLFYFVRIY